MRCCSPAETRGHCIREQRRPQGYGTSTVSAHPRAEDPKRLEQSWFSEGQHRWSHAPVSEHRSPWPAGRTLCRWIFNQLVPDSPLPASHRRPHLSRPESRIPRGRNGEIQGRPSPPFGRNVHRPGGAPQDYQRGEEPNADPYGGGAVGNSPRIRIQCQGRGGGRRGWPRVIGRRSGAGFARSRV